MHRTTSLLATALTVYRAFGWKLSDLARNKEDDTPLASRTLAGSLLFSHHATDDVNEATPPPLVIWHSLGKQRSFLGGIVLVTS